MKYHLVGLGNLIVDILAQVSHDLLTQLALVPGSMNLVDKNESLNLRRALENPSYVSGGSVANTVASLSILGGHAGLIGVAAADNLGDKLRAEVKKLAIDFDLPPVITSNSTGSCVVFITPDGQRTMNTHLGVCEELRPEMVRSQEQMMADSKITLLEGYLLDIPHHGASILNTAAEIVKSHGKIVALALSDPECVKRNRSAMLHLASNYADVIIGFEDEVTALFQTPDLDAALNIFSEKDRILVATRGKEGCSIAGPHGVEKFPPPKVDRVIDTTGAGDAFAAGFLMAWSENETIEACADAGSQAAARVLRVIGPRMESQLLQPEFAGAGTS